MTFVKQQFYLEVRALNIKTTLAEFMCMTCGGLFPLSRKSHKLKGENHIKKLWCINCKERTKHVEKLRDKTDLRLYPVSAYSKNAIENDDVDWEKIFNLKTE